MSEGEKWTVVVHMASGFKITYTVGTKDMAVEYARTTLQRGPYMVDDRGVRTYYPPSAVDKVKVVPPGVELGKTKVVVS